MSHYLIILFRYISLLKQAGNDEDAEMLHEMGIVDGRQKMRDYDDETNDVLLRVVLAIRVVAPKKFAHLLYSAEVKCFALSYYSSLINHDCFNNSALAIGKGGNLMAYAVTPIKENEQELYHDYDFFLIFRSCSLWQTFAETLPPNILQAASMDHASIDNNWYLTTQQIISNKITIELVYTHMYESSPAAAFCDTHFVGSL
uniref:SET domain-containing protein n=1 Tax=Trichogramma kaykai TaxID=54128 RepID=A0ABD2XIM7_9HYME